MKTCEQCSSSLEDNAMFCWKCGKSVLTLNASEFPIENKKSTLSRVVKKIFKIISIFFFTISLLFVVHFIPSIFFGMLTSSYKGLLGYMSVVSNIAILGIFFFLMIKSFRNNNKWFSWNWIIFLTIVSIFAVGVNLLFIWTNAKETMRSYMVVETENMENTRNNENTNNIGNNESDKNNAVEENTTILPNSFTIQFRSDNSSSSGAIRLYAGELTFLNDKLITGSQDYHGVIDPDCKENCSVHTQCILKNQQWVEKNAGGECKIHDFIYLTKEEIEQQIVSKKIIQSENFDNCHSRICYKIKETDLTASKNNPKISKSDDPYGRYIDKDCKIINGCNGAHCVDKSFDESDWITTCEMLPESTCYKKEIAKCEKQKTGNCGWAETPELKTCIDNARKIK